jgi:hypothetical protein
MSEFNLEKNPLVQSYYPEPVEAEEAEVIAAEKGSDDSTKLPESITKEEPNTRTPFASFDEAQAAIREGFTGKYSVGGKPYKTEGVSLDSDHPLNTDKVTDEDLMEAELLEMKKFEEEDNLKEQGAVDKYFDQQAKGAFRVGAATTEEQVEGSRPGEREIDTDTFVDRSFQGEGESDEAMDLSEAPTTVVTDKIMDIVDAMPPRTPKANRKEWAMKEFRKRYINADISDEELEVKVDTFLEFANQ